ncbi:Os10g0396050 [Oryza sativa Japonica Group]|uniref:Os10g0396050 protein n=1 Tax=Oryza sativa subsp. japonica TaxID=39947 RepID=A0A0P0XUT8_ORYSJ|nr:Os10g0396050 [Oryza sativa Japonica Group]
MGRTAAGAWGQRRQRWKQQQRWEVEGEGEGGAGVRQEPARHACRLLLRPQGPGAPRHPHVQARPRQGPRRPQQRLQAYQDIEFHPALLHETYIETMEDGYIYFFSKRQFATKARNKRRPMRVADGGTWKASGGSKKVGGIDVSQKFTMVFYERRFEGDRNPVKTNWGMHEFTKIIPGTKN